MPRNADRCDGSNNANVNGDCGAVGEIGNGTVSVAAAAATAAGGNDGCVYENELIMEKGVAFDVRYTGCVEVQASMKSLDFITRTEVARECIDRVCEAAGLKSASKRRADKKISQYIADRPCMKNAGTNVIMKVSSRAFDLINQDTGEIIASHNMPRISFASGGDSDTIDFVAYIAKNEDEWRACYVVECIGGQSGDLIVTIGKAFMLRYNALNKKKLIHKKGKNPPDNYNIGKENDKDYYNDLPDKLPPDLLTDDDIKAQIQLQQQQQQVQKQQKQQQRQMQQNKLQQQPQQQQQNHQKSQQQQQQQQHSEQKISQLNLKKPRERLSSNLIDLNSPPPEQTTNKYNLSLFDPMKQSETTNAINNVAQPRDVFDMQPFSLSAEVQRSQLMTESWFHPGISRAIAESLLIADGDFLVRESQGKQGQYVLTGLEGKNSKHLLLIDPEGVVRTKDRIFDSISHLINYHWTNSLPIISEDSELVLRNPVIRPGFNENCSGNGNSAGGGGGGILKKTKTPKLTTPT